MGTIGTADMSPRLKLRAAATPLVMAGAVWATSAWSSIALGGGAQTPPPCGPDGICHAEHGDLWRIPHHTVASVPRRRRWQAADRGGGRRNRTRRNSAVPSCPGRRRKARWVRPGRRAGGAPRRGAGGRGRGRCGCGRAGHLARAKCRCRELNCQGSASLRLTRGGRGAG